MSETKEHTASVNFIAAVPFALLILSPIAILDAVVIRDCWNWFLVPVGVKAITAWWAFGLNLVWRSFADAPITREGEKYGIRQYATAILRLLLLWGMGYAAHLWL